MNGSLDDQNGVARLLPRPHPTVPSLKRAEDGGLRLAVLATESLQKNREIYFWHRLPSTPRKDPNGRKPSIEWYGVASYRNSLRYREVSSQPGDQNTFPRQ